MKLSSCRRTLLWSWVCLTSQTVRALPIQATPRGFTAIEGCSADNWGLPDEAENSKPPFDPEAYDFVNKHCANRWVENIAAGTIPSATALHYKDTAAYNTFTATDLIPENKHLWTKTSPWAQHLTFKKKNDKDVMLSECYFDSSVEDPTLLVRPAITSINQLVNCHLRPH